MGKYREHRRSAPVASLGTHPSKRRFESAALLYAECCIGKDSVDSLLKRREASSVDRQPESHLGLWQRVARFFSSGRMLARS